jgi:hypothetical protein
MPGVVPPGRRFPVRFKHLAQGRLRAALSCSGGGTAQPLDLVAGESYLGCRDVLLQVLDR